MIPSAVPLKLQNLTQFEEMLIARAFPIIHVYTKPKGGQRAYKGHNTDGPNTCFNVKHWTKVENIYKTMINTLSINAD